MYANCFSVYVPFDLNHNNSLPGKKKDWLFSSQSTIILEWKRLGIANLMANALCLASG